ncbi:MAG: EamA family transporter [Bacteroidales bacterium]|nr:EamA family transporter [Bacteroidales bacterium]
MNGIIHLVDLNKKIWQWSLLTMLALIWGSSFILMKKGLLSFTDIQVASFRIFISFVLLLPLTISRIKRVKRRHIIPLLVVGFLGNGLPAFLFTKAQTQVSSSMAGVLNALTPLFALLVGLIIYKVKFIWHNILGIIVGLFGAAALVLISSGFNISAQNLYPLLIVLATIFYAFSVNVIKQKLADLDSVTIIAAAFTFIGPFGGILLLGSDFSKALTSPNLIQNFSCIFLLALLSSVLATILFNYLIKYTTALFASSVTYVIPIVAIFWGLIDGESIIIPQFFAIGAILIGVYLVNKKRA